MAKNSVAGLLTSVDDLFSTQESRDEAKLERVINLSPAEISDFPNHPFKVRMDEEMQQMAESVKEHGVLVPALVREKPDGGYEMIAGHRRKRAAELAELSKIPCIVRNLTDDEAIIVMVDSNLQREKILPSEKAFAYKMKLDAMKRQGQRTDLTSSPLATKFSKKRSDQELAELVGEGKDNIRRYIRLTYLLPEMLDMVDDGKIALRPAVELSYLATHSGLERKLFDIICPGYQVVNLGKDILDLLIGKERRVHKVVFGEFHIGFGTFSAIGLCLTELTPLTAVVKVRLEQ